MAEEEKLVTYLNFINLILSWLFVFAIMAMVTNVVFSINVAVVAILIVTTTIVVPVIVFVTNVAVCMLLGIMCDGMNGASHLKIQPCTDNANI